MTATPRHATDFEMQAGIAAKVAQLLAGANIVVPRLPYGCTLRPLKRPFVQRQIGSSNTPNEIAGTSLDDIGVPAVFGNFQIRHLGSTADRASIGSEGDGSSGPEKRQYRAKLSW